AAAGRPPRNSTPVARRGRKATGLSELAGLPNGAISMFWDGQRWIPDNPTSDRRPRSPLHPRRLRDWLATIPLVLLLPALLAPILATEAVKPTLAPGAVLTLRGTVAPGSSVKLTRPRLTPANGAD